MRSGRCAELLVHQQHDPGAERARCHRAPHCAGARRSFPGYQVPMGAAGADRHDRRRGPAITSPPAVRRPHRRRDLQRQRLEPLPHEPVALPRRDLPGRQHPRSSRAGFRPAAPCRGASRCGPRDTLGNYGDTIVVANSGGVELSIIDVRPGVRRLVWRQDLPDYLVETYKVLLSAAARADHPLRPVRPAAVRRDGVPRRQRGRRTAARTRSSRLYSTTPTNSQPVPFTGKATLRMEKLINTTDTTQLFGHLFWGAGRRQRPLVDDGRDTLRHRHPARSARTISKRSSSRHAPASRSISPRLGLAIRPTCGIPETSHTRSWVKAGTSRASFAPRRRGTQPRARLIANNPMPAQCITGGLVCQWCVHGRFR